MSRQPKYFAFTGPDGLQWRFNLTKLAIGCIDMETGIASTAIGSNLALGLPGPEKPMMNPLTWLFGSPPETKEPVHLGNNVWVFKEDLAEDSEFLAR